jgi:hypothetical protein
MATRNSIAWTDKVQAREIIKPKKLDLPISCNQGRRTRKFVGRELPVFVVNSMTNFPHSTIYRSILTKVAVAGDFAKPVTAPTKGGKIVKITVVIQWASFL